MPLYQVTVNARVIYEIDAKTEKEAEKQAIEAVKSNITPNDMEYVGDGIDNIVEV